MNRRSSSCRPTDRVFDAVAAILKEGVAEVGPREAEWLIDAAGSDNEAISFALRRAAGEPLQYLIGTAPFRHIELRVGPGVLIPRPETEIVVERALERLPDGGTLLDVGTGSGAIALAAKNERPDARVIATDVSEEALSWFDTNLHALGLDVDIYRSDLFAGLPESLAGEPDVVVSNPPYVASGEADSLPVDVVEHEPHVALFAGEDGLATIRDLVSQAPRWLCPAGWLVMEIGETQASEVRALLDGAGYSNVAIHPDMTGRERIAEGRAPHGDGS